MRTKSVAFVPDVSADADYRIASGIVQAELCAPMLADGRLVGIVNVEAGAGRGLDESDVGTMALVADRLASALALAGERERLAARAELFRRLTTFATAVNGTLDPDRLNQAIVERILEVVAADSVALTILDRGTSQYLLRAVTGPDRHYVGLPVEPGDGLAGRAIRDRAMVIDDRFEPSRSPILSAPGGPTEPMSGAAVPLIRDDVVVGALTVIRNDIDRPFAPNEVEALPILAGLVALAITNTFLHMEVTELSVRDALTGLFNRRHLDASISRMEASRTRRAASDREPAAAIIFDLDHFGAINKRYGHHTGDQILRAFADILRARFRGADLVARYGGEEFVAILERTTPGQAAAIAEEVRSPSPGSRCRRPTARRSSRRSRLVAPGWAPTDDRFADILGRADVGLVMAKRAGRNRVISA
jgi:diguanylate cyclase (GGDEF)-like protein